MDNIFSYLFEFLLQTDDPSALAVVSYGSRADALVVVQPSGFFDPEVYLTDRSLPTLPLAELEGMPVLFGKPHLRREDRQLIVEADLIASAFFLLTRYEECIRRDVRDAHGRFPGRESLSYRAGFLGRAVVDEYGAFLRRLLREQGVPIEEPAGGYSHIYLTHDVDQIWTWDNVYRALRSTVRRVLTQQKDKLLPFKALRNYQKYDPVYTFSWLIEQDERVWRFYEGACTSVYFLMSAEVKTGFDNGYFKNKARTAELIDRLYGSGAVLGYHLSYQASQNANLVRRELARLRAASPQPIRWQRNHYLDSREPEDMRILLENDITDDFTMGYADQAGFRLGTCRPVRWIDPLRRQITDLTLHPMTVMEGTLDGPQYMNLGAQEAYLVVCELLTQVKTHGGEAVLLWHSPSVYPSPNSYQRDLYLKTLNNLIEDMSSCDQSAGE